MLGHQGIARNHPDYDALTVLDHIFGSGPGFSRPTGPGSCATSSALSMRLAAA